MNKTLQSPIRSPISPVSGNEVAPEKPLNPGKASPVQYIFSSRVVLPMILKLL